MIKAIIVDDEEKSRKLLRNMLENYCQDVKVVGMASDVGEGVTMIQNIEADLLFLDIEMPSGDGFDLLNKLEDATIPVIFITGYSDYAIKAIKYAALDYILKPIDLTELRSAVAKAKNMERLASQQIRQLQRTFRESDSPIDHIVIHERNHHTLIQLSEIIYIEARGNYVMFFNEDETKKLASYSLNHYESFLPESDFFRIHKSHIINLNKVKSFEGGRTGKVFLQGNIELDIAARRKSNFTKIMSRFS